MMTVRTLALLLLPAIQQAQTPDPALLILSKADRALLIADPATLKITGRTPSGPDPHEVVGSDDGKTAYISNYGGGAYHTITPVDLGAVKTLAAIDLGPLTGPHGLFFAAGKLWFTAEGAKAIGSYSPESHHVEWVMGTGQDRTHMIHVSADGKHILTTNVNAGTVSILEEAVGRAPGPPGPQGPRWEHTVIGVGDRSEGFDVSPDNKEAWVANAGPGTVSVIDLASRTVVQTIKAEAQGANRLKFTPDGKRVFISTLRGPDLVILDAATRQVIKRLRIGSGAAGILMQPGGSRAFVACTPDNYVQVIDLATLGVTGKISGIKEPDGLAWAKR